MQTISALNRKYFCSEMYSHPNYKTRSLSVSQTLLLCVTISFKNTNILTHNGQHCVGSVFLFLRLSFLLTPRSLLLIAIINKRVQSTFSLFKTLGFRVHSDPNWIRYDIHSWVERKSLLFWDWTRLCPIPSVTWHLNLPHCSKEWIREMLPKRLLLTNMQSNSPIGIKPNYWEVKATVPAMVLAISIHSEDILSNIL